MSDNELNIRISSKDGHDLSMADLAVVLKALDQSYKALAGNKAELIIKELLIEEENKC